MSKAGRFIFAVPFLMFGAMHLMESKMFASMSPISPGTGLAQALTIIVGIGLIGGAVSLVTKKYIKIVMLLLALELLIFIGLSHLPNVMSDNEAMKMMGMINLLKDLGLLGGALFIGGTLGTEKK